MPDVGSRGFRAAVALGVASAWGLGWIIASIRPEHLPPVDAVDYLVITTFSLALASLAPAAWLLERHATRAAAPTTGIRVDVRSAAIILAVCGPMAGFGNIAEEWAGLVDLGVGLYFVGLIGIFTGLIGSSILLAIDRRWVPAGASAVILVALLLGTDVRLGFLAIFVVWSGFSTWLLRGRDERDDPQSASAEPR